MERLILEQSEHTFFFKLELVNMIYINAFWKKKLGMIKSISRFVFMIY